MAIRLAGDHATCCASRQLAELPTQQSSNKQWPSVQYVSDYVCIFVGYRLDYSALINVKSCSQERSAIESGLGLETSNFCFYTKTNMETLSVGAEIKITTLNLAPKTNVKTSGL